MLQFRHDDKIVLSERKINHAQIRQNYDEEFKKTP